MSKALVILSGGQDSTVALFLAVQAFDEVAAISFDYGQRHRIELECAEKIASIAGVHHERVDIRGLLLSRSPLIDPTAALEQYDSHEAMQKIIGDRLELTFVPMRNALFFTVAANRALQHDCYRIVTGVCQDDAANYPDCGSDFIALQQQTINQSLGLIDRFKIEAPLLHMSKAQTIQLATELNGCMDALAHSHTCYAGEYPPCGKCHSCVLRAEGFKQAGLSDPIFSRAAQ